MKSLNGNQFSGTRNAIWEGNNSQARPFLGAVPGVKVRGMTFQHYTEALVGGTDWTIRDVASKFHGSGGIKFDSASRCLIFGGVVDSNDQYGISGPASIDCTVDGLEIVNNNVGGHDPYWDAGGSKFVRTLGLIVQHVNTHDNHGSGLWFDIDNDDVYCGYNTVEDNTAGGIWYEISYTGQIVHNYLAGGGSRTV